MTVTTIERSFARATVYRLLSLLFSYPAEDVYEETRRGLDAALVASPLMADEVARSVGGVARALAACGQDGLEGAYRRLFTYSASPDCPLSECAYSAKHVYQEVQEMADIAGFYRAFGLEISGQRPDDLSAELEFCYLLALKQGHAREQRRRREETICRDAHRAFLHDHLGRWADNIGRRLQVLAPDSPYASFGHLLCAFAAAEIEYLKAGPIQPHQDIPSPPEPPEDDECPAVAGAPVDVAQEDLVAELMPVGEARKGG